MPSKRCGFSLGSPSILFLREKEPVKRAKRIFFHPTKKAEVSIWLFFLVGGCWFFRCVCVRHSILNLGLQRFSRKTSSSFRVFFFRFPQRLFEGHKTTSGPLVVLLLYYNPWWSYKHTTRNCEDFMKVCWSFGFRFNSPRFHTPRFGYDPIIKISTQTEAHCTISSDLGHWWILIFWILGLRVGLYVVDARKCLVLQFGPALFILLHRFPSPPPKW